MKSVPIQLHPKVQAAPPFALRVHARPVFNALIRMSAVLWILNAVAIGLENSSLSDHRVSVSLLRHFGLDIEQNFSSLYSALLLFTAACLLLLIARVIPPFAPFRRSWRFLGILFLGLTLDEALSIHERLIPLIGNMPQLTLPSWLQLAWVIPYGIGCLVLLIVYSRFLLHLRSNVRNGFLLSGSIFIGSALGLELLEGWLLVDYRVNDFPFRLVSSLQEMGEMAGICLFIRTLLGVLAHNRFKLIVNGDAPQDALTGTANNGHAYPKTWSALKRSGYRLPVPGGQG